MERFLTYIIVPLAMGCVFFVFMTRDRSIKGAQTAIPIQSITEQNSNEQQQTIIPFNDHEMEVPLMRMQERIIVKSFGMFITPETSPIQGERFRGYHTGVDLEIIDDERDGDVKVFAICDGDVIYKGYVNGYGGVIIQKCTIDNKQAFVIYGHMRLSSIANKIGDRIGRADPIGFLGSDKSIETDYERKHLHLGIYNGANFNVRGYVESQQALVQWVDPCIVIECIGEIDP